ncbi:MAG: HAD family hydrolase [Candidatus Helarchaeota archaeon]|nr:HAD family hydrolase [Candidatus Helarchaeota archaeon]
MAEMKYNTVIFDLGFTLFTFENFTLKRYFATLNKGLDQLTSFLMKKNIMIDSILFKKKFKKFRNRNLQLSLMNYKESTTLDTLNQTFESLNLPKLNPKEAHEAIMVYHSTEGKFWKLRPFSKPLLEQLQTQKFKIGLLSNAPYHEGIKFLLDSTDLTQYFNVIATSAQIGYCKPDKRTFEYILNKIQSNPQQSIMIGDDLKNDIYGAKRLGMRAIRVKRDFAITPNEDVNVVPDEEISDLEEVLPIIHKWNDR